MRKSQKIDITIPAGMQDGTRLRVRGKGNSGKQGGTRGDLYVVAMVEPHPRGLQRDGDDILSDIEISVFDAMMGCTREIETVRGMVDLKIKSGT